MHTAITRLVRAADAVDARLRVVTDDRRRRRLLELRRRIEWRVNALATPRAYRSPGYHLGP
jgi:hypothetical protein